MSIQSNSKGSRAFNLFNYIFLFTAALLCILPIINIIAISLSEKSATAANLVTFWPVGFNLKAYILTINNKDFLTSFLISFKRVLVGVSINMILVVSSAYPLAQEDKKFKGRSFFVWFFVFTMLFNGGLVPLFITINKLYLYNSFWALILPTAVPVFNVIIMMNFFKGLPQSISEAAMIDGAGHWRILFSIFIPLSLPSVATLTLFAVVYHWNDYFSGLFLLADNNKWPLQTYLYSQLFTGIDYSRLSAKEAMTIATISNRSLRAAQILIAMIPILIVYPFLQRFFVTGLTIGSIKE